MYFKPVLHTGMKSGKKQKSAKGVLSLKIDIMDCS